MFEHYGLKDVFVAIWKYKWRILVISFCVAAVCTVAGKCIPVTEEVRTEVETGDAEVLEGSSIEFYLEYRGNDKDLSSKVLNSIYIDTLSKDSCRSFVADEVLKRFSKEELVNKIGGNVKEEEITPNFIAQYFSSALDATGVGVTFAVVSPEKSLTQGILDAYMAWVDKLLTASDETVSLVEVRKENYRSPIIVQEAETIAESKQMSVAVIFVLVFIAVFCIISIVVCAIALFNPTVNRRNDFEEMGIKVIGDFSHKKEL